MNIYQFMSESPIVTIILGILALCAIYGVCNLIWFSINRFFRTMNIRKQGWPPSHCDADGDFKKGEENGI